MRLLGDGGGSGADPSRSRPVNSGVAPEPTGDLHDVTLLASPRLSDSRASDGRRIVEDTAEAIEILSPTSTVAPGWSGAIGVGEVITP